MAEYYIGLMSGTSMDGIDAVLVDFSNQQVQLIASCCLPWQAKVAQQLKSLFSISTNEIIRLGETDGLVAIAFAEAVQQLLKISQLSAEEITAIGSHGQTIRHYPNHDPAFSLQIGDPNRIACLTNIATIADFRRKDIALGGQGAPLVPAFHDWCFYNENKNQAVLNIGGIANLTLLPTDRSQIKGFDTGPGNRLLDDWINQTLNKKYDNKGDWARTGQINQALLNRLLADPYFQQPLPKSTGFEYFNLPWLKQKLDQLGNQLKAEDIQATLSLLTAKTIAADLTRYLPPISTLFVCGGGARNGYLMQLLQNELADIAIQNTQQQGIDADLLEAIAFAWLARQHIKGLPGNIPSATGASRAAILGTYCPP